jgi:tellurium resistance protein TerZ
MSIELNKKTGINLSKGTKISLEKAGKTLEKIQIGLNWGKIKTSALWGLIASETSVDLDGSVAVFDENNNILEIIYYGRKYSQDGAVRHSGDDLVGDSVNDDIDNEVIEVNLKKLAPNAQTLFFFLTSYKKQDFATIPYANIRIFDLTTQQEILATYNVASESNFAGYIAMVMGKVVRVGNGWQFTAIGEPLVTREGVQDATKEIQRKFLNNE